MTRATARLLACCLACSALVACAPEIGDECQTSLDCSSQGSRLCDRTQPGGYCTLRGCEPGTCPEEAVCVKFRPAQERLATTWCMARCEGNGDCRTDQGYRCTRAEEFGSGAGEAEIQGRSDQRFCAVAAPPAAVPSERPQPPPADGGRDDAGP